MAKLLRMPDRWRPAERFASDESASSPQLLTNGEIPLVPVESRTIAAVGYDEPTRTLVLEFTASGVYRYYDVPAYVHHELMAASSIGRYVTERIKGRYRFES
jgi:hypothetical protein